MSVHFKCQKQFYFEQFSLVQVHSLLLCDPSLRPYQTLPLRARVDIETMTIKRYSVFPNAPALLEPHHQIISCHIQDTCSGWGLPLCSRCILLPQLTGPSLMVFFFISLLISTTSALSNSLNKECLQEILLLRYTLYL